MHIDCQICMRKCRQKITKLFCRHIFHTRCLMLLSTTSATRVRCPICARNTRIQAQCHDTEQAVSSLVTEVRPYQASKSRVNLRVKAMASGLGIKSQPKKVVASTQPYSQVVVVKKTNPESYQQQLEISSESDESFDSLHGEYHPSKESQSLFPTIETEDGTDLDQTPDD